MKDLGKLHYFLGIQIQYHEGGMFLSQQKYAEDLLAVAGMSTCASVATPLPQQLKRKSPQSGNSAPPSHSTPFANPKYFRSLAGRLQYLTLTRPDLQFSVNYVCQKMHDHTVSDFNLLKRILRYIKGTSTMGISFDRYSDSKLTAYSDSDYAGCEKSSRSTGGFCTFLGRNMISWSSRKQDTVSKSSTEAEYRAMSEATSEITWFVNLLQDLGMQTTATPELFCDNLSAVYLTANPSFHSRTKHFATHYHYIREQVAFGNIIVNHISADFQIADIFTKSLPQRPFELLRLKLGVDLPPTPSLRGSVKNRDQNDVALQKGLLGPRPNTFPKPIPAQRLPVKHDKEKRKPTPSDCTTMTTKNRFAALESCGDNEST
ncbi:PREDICTED: uncharacterized protein LOC109132832 [Camelina sativa]|uniref:Uncharacterized protein LOC109132832 n=1 Tax=Camelina sativa TaxID=90675 RepID=A0ABM1RP62_CAMSA|nr:PREDICTED: uncharacterized protein LOC109132832 [Camelina sativa]